MSEVIETPGQVVKDDFHWTTMGEIADVIGGGTPRTSDPQNFKGGDIPWITPADLSGYSEKFIAGGNRHITRKGLESSSARMLPAGAVLFTSRAPIGYVAIAKNPIATNQGFKNFVLKEGILPEYVYWWLKGSKQTAESYASGTTFLELSGANAKKLPIPMVSLSRQRDIVAEIEKQFSRLDEAVANLQRVKANLKRYKASVLKDAVEGRLVPTDGNWTHTKLGEVALSVRNGYSHKPDADAGTRIFRISAVRPMELKADDVRYLSGPASDYESFMAVEGDVLFTRYNGSRDYVGVCALVPGGMPPTVYPDKLIRVRMPTSVLLPAFVVIAASTGRGRDFIESMIRTTAGQSGVSGSDIKAIPIAIPPLVEQIRIVAEADRRLSLVRSVEDEVNANLRRANALRQSVLQRAFSAAPSVKPAIPTQSESEQTILLARLIDQLLATNTQAGRIVLMKCAYVAPRHAKIESANDVFHRMAAGPANLPWLEQNLSQLSALGWFREVVRQNSKSNRTEYFYERLTKADEYKQHLQRFSTDQLSRIDRVAGLFRGMKADQAELFATVYAAWNDLVIANRAVTDDAIVNELHAHWHVSKQRFTAELIGAEIKKINSQGLAPSGFGASTTGKHADHATGDLFHGPG